MTREVLDSVWDAGMLVHDYGNDFFEWINLVHNDWDDVDRIYVDHETNGGG